MGSARVLGESERLGSLELGKLENLILGDLDQPHLSQLHDPIQVIAYNAQGTRRHTRDGRRRVRRNRSSHDQL
jgi:cytosine/adenosine deaminase-related metal-dependent hydrolase